MYIKLYNVILIFALFSCTRPEISKYTEYINHSDTVAYVGKETCKQCHYEIYESYMQTAMGQSFRFATSENSSIDTPKLGMTLTKIYPIWAHGKMIVCG